jgi:hypothetical protein
MTTLPAKRPGAKMDAKEGGIARIESFADAAFDFFPHHRHHLHSNATTGSHSKHNRKTVLNTHSYTAWLPRTRVHFTIFVIS